MSGEVQTLNLDITGNLLSCFLFSEQLEEESTLEVSIWLKLSEMMSSPPLHLTIPPPSTLTSPLYWLALLHHTGDPVERIFSLYKEKMQLRRFWDDRKDLLRASLPLTSDLSAPTADCLDCSHTDNNYLADWGTFLWRGIFQSTFPRSHPRAYFLLFCTRAVVETFCFVPLGAVCVAGAWRSARTDGCARDTKDWQLFAHLLTGLLFNHIFDAFYCLI